MLPTEDVTLDWAYRNHHPIHVATMCRFVARSSYRVIAAPQGQAAPSAVWAFGRGVCDRVIVSCLTVVLEIDTRAAAPAPPHDAKLVDAAQKMVEWPFKRGVLDQPGNGLHFVPGKHPIFVDGHGSVRKHSLYWRASDAAARVSPQEVMLVNT